MEDAMVTRELDANGSESIKYEEEYYRKKFYIPFLIERLNLSNFLLGDEEWLLYVTVKFAHQRLLAVHPSWWYVWEILLTGFS